MNEHEWLHELTLWAMDRLDVGIEPAQRVALAVFHRADFPRTATWVASFGSMAGWLARLDEGWLHERAEAVA